MEPESTTAGRTPPCEIAIVGIGCLFPKAAGTGHFWANVKSGLDCIGDIPKTHWNPDDYFDADPKSPDMTYARRGGFLDPVDFNPMEFGIAPRDLEATDTTQLLGLVAAKQALNDAKVDFEKVDRSRVSVILGVTGTLELVVPLGARLGHPHWRKAMKDAGIPDELAKDAVERIGEAYVPWQENSFPGLLGNVVAGRIANRLDLHGTNCVVDAACASSLSAVHLASLELAAGRADVVVTGGADTFNDIFMFMCFSKTPALSPTGNSKPFDAAGDGTILGEGIGTVVLKRRADAERDGDTIYAVIKSVGTSSDGKGNAIYAPSADGQVRCLTNAYDLAGVTPDTIELIEAHGTGTKVGDGVEASALTKVFSEKSVTAKARPWCALGSVKSQIGHTKAAAGVAGLIKAALALYNKVLPPTIKVTQPVDPLKSTDSPFYVNLEARPWLPRREHPRRAGLSAFGFGGSNFHCVLEEHRLEKRDPDWDGTVEIFAKSGRSVHDLTASIEILPIEWDAFARAAAESRATIQETDPFRLVLVAHRTRTDLATLRSATLGKLNAQPDGEWSIPEGAYFGSGNVAGTLAVLFPGQGSQAPGMLRDLVNLFPEALTSVALADAADVSRPDNQPRLSDFIYPPTSFEADAHARHVAALTQTQRAQTALGAVEFGAWKILNGRFGVQAGAAAGHSYGELAALSAAGRISPADFFRLSAARGRLMAEMKTTGASGMTAILADGTAVQSILDAAGGQAVIANRNSPKQTVISGSLDDLERAERICTSRSLRFVRLPVAAAFHSPVVASAAAPFRETLNAVGFESGPMAVFANSTAMPYPADPAACRDLLGHQLAKPVLFEAQIRAMANAGVRTFLEVGPGAKLTRMTAEILAHDPAVTSSIACIALDSSSGSRPGTLDLAHTLARLAARGHAVTLSAWERESRCQPAERTTKPGLTVPICGANYVTPRPARPPREPKPATDETMMAEPVRPNPLHSTTLAAALDATQRTLAVLQQMQDQTASLHRQFLETQQQAQQTIAALVAQQHAVLGLPVAAMPPVAMPMPAPESRPVPVAEPIPAAISRPVERPVERPIERPAPDVAVPHAPPVASRGPSPDKILLDVVAEKTGYPVSTLDLSMSLDNDLGVDSIKRVEILSALQDRLPDAPVVKPEHLGTLHTLKDVADFLAGGLAAAVPAVVAAPAAAASAAALISSIPASAANSIADVLLDVVSQKTGYPVGTLDLGMTMDNDLGIDSIKRVEILSSIQERLPAAPAVKPEHLGTIRSLKDLADFLGGTPNPATVKIPIDPQTMAELTHSSRGGRAASPPIPSEGIPEFKEPETETISKIKQAVATDSVLTSSGSIPVPPPRPSETVTDTGRPLSGFAAGESIDRSVLQAVDLDAASVRPRIAVPEGRDVMIVGDDGPFCREAVRLVKSAGFNAVKMPWTAVGTARLSDSLAGLILLAPHKSNPEPQLNTLAFQWIQRAGGTIRNGMKPSGVGVIATVSQFDGSFGITSPDTETDPAAGGLSGLIKTVYHEWPEVAAKAVDIAPAFVAADPAKAAAAVVEEILAVGPVEIGISANHRCSLDLARTVRRPATGALPLGANDVFLITGGARGVTAEAAVALAMASKGMFVLTGRTAPPPAVDPAWIAGIDDPAVMKKAIADQIGSTATPKAVADQYSRIQSQREIRSTIQRIEATGGRAVYFPVNVSNARAVADLLLQIRSKFGPVTALVHGAGVLADRRIEQLTIDQFETVYGTKAGGARLLLDLLRNENLKAIVLFGSTTGRLGRVGQLAYACANEVLNKLAQIESKRRPHARVVCINWGPWDGGMVTPGLRKMFESEGVGLIPLVEGGQFVVQELTTPGKAVEVVALGKLRGHSYAAPRAGDARGSGAIQNLLPRPQVPPPTAAPAAELTVAFERTVDVASHPVLRSHVLDGRAVLPMAIHLEWLAHAALHGNPGLQFIGIDNLRITSGVQIEAGASATLKALAGRAVKQDKAFVVPVELRGRRKDGREVVHSRADVLLAATLPTAPAPDRIPAVQPYPHPVDEVYKYFLFHGPDLHAIERVDGLTETAFLGTAAASPPPTAWFAAPLRSNWVADPLVLDASFQMLILWSFAQHGAGSLPCFAGRYRQYRRAFPTGPVKVAVRVTRDNGTFARADIEYLDTDGTMIAQLQDYECVIDAQLNMAFRRNQLAGGLVRA